MSKYIITLLNGNEEELKENCEIIDVDSIEQMQNLIKQEFVKNLIKNKGESYGLRTKLVKLPNNELYFLERDNNRISNYCYQIIPLFKNSSLNLYYGEYYCTQKGIIYCSSVVEGKYFLAYSIDKKKNKTNFNTTKTKYCVLDKISNTLIPIKNFKESTKKYEVETQKIKEQIEIYITNYKNDFNINEMYTSLIRDNIITEKDLKSLLKVINNMIKENKLMYTEKENKEIFYRNVNQYKKTLTPNIKK